MAELTDPLVDKLKDMVECAICLDPFKDPRSLPCQHTFCRECLDGVLGTGKKLRCPYCKKEVPVPNGVLELAVDFRANSWLEILSEYEKAKEAKEAAAAPSEAGWGENSNEDRESSNPAVYHQGDVTNFQTLTPEAQLLLNIDRNLDDTEALFDFLGHLIDLYGSLPCSDQKRTVETTLTAIERYPHDADIQVKGSCILGNILTREAVNLDCNAIRRVVSAMVDIVDNHRDQTNTLMNGCMVLLAVIDRQDIENFMFLYERLVTILVEVIATDDQDEALRCLGIDLLSKTSTHVDRQGKQLVGDLDAIPTMMKIIRQKLDNGLCDDTLIAAWCMLVNITADTPLNGLRFINEGGMDYGLQCLETFKEDLLVHRVLGLMSNIAEVTDLRPYLQETQYIQLFSWSLNTGSQAGQISFTACSILAHLVSDGQAVWLVDDPPRLVILSHIVQAISRWNVSTKFTTFFYNTLKPILGLLKKYDTPECQHFAMWTICNFITTNPETYCPMLEKEGGLVLIKEVLHDPRPYTEIRQLGKHVIGEYDKYCAEHGMVSDAGTAPTGNSGQDTGRGPTQQISATGDVSEQQREACPVCEQIPTTSKNLSCGHFVCGNCASFLLPVLGDTLHCPTCSLQTRILQDASHHPTSPVRDQQDHSGASSFSQLLDRFEPLTRAHSGVQGPQRISASQHQNTPAPLDTPRPSFLNHQKPSSPPTPLIPFPLNSGNASLLPRRLPLSRAGPVFPNSTSSLSSQPQAAVTETDHSAASSFSQLLDRFEPLTRAHSGVQGPPRISASQHQYTPAPPDTPRPSFLNRQKPSSPPTPLRPFPLNSVNASLLPRRLPLSRAGPVFPNSTSSLSSQPQAAVTETGRINSPASPDRPQSGHEVSLEDILRRRMTLRKTPK